MSEATDLFKAKVEVALTNVRSLEVMRENDKMVDYVFKIGRELFAGQLDNMPEDWCVRTGGRLTGIYGYLGNLSAYARAERDVYEQKLKEVESELMTQKLDGKYKVTEARALIAIETAELKALVIAKETEKNNYENLIEAVDKMISFIQSALRYKDSERYKTRMAGQ